MPNSVSRDFRRVNTFFPKHLTTGGGKPRPVSKAATTDKKRDLPFDVTKTTTAIQNIIVDRDLSTTCVCGAVRTLDRRQCPVK